MTRFHHRVGVAAVLGALQVWGCAGSVATTPPTMAMAPDTDSGLVGRHAIAPVYDPAVIPPPTAIPGIGQALPQRLVTKKQVLTSPLTARPLPVTPIAEPELDARVLVISADGQEADLPAIRQALDYLGVPYTVWTATQAPGGLTPDQLASGSHGFYQGVILTTGNLGSFDGASWDSALSDAEWTALWAYETAFGVRQVTWYTLPTADYGFGAATAVDTSAEPVTGGLTGVGRVELGYLNPNASLRFENAYAYLAAPADASLTPWVTDSAGHVLVGVKRYGDGRENLAVTVDSNPALTHTLALGYGLVNWVTRGLFVGDRHVTMCAHVDDFFIADALADGSIFRMADTDLQAALAWQQDRRRRAQMADFRLDLAFDGAGVAEGVYRPDTLAPLAAARQGEFKWIDHTYRDRSLDGANRANTADELAKNLVVAKQLGLTSFSNRTLITPDGTGLSNVEALSAMVEAGVRFVVSDTSRPGQANPAPVTGRVNPYQPAVFEIPRYPTNLYYNVSTPDEWTAEYNRLYHGYWGRDLAYDEVLDKESAMLVRYLIKGDANPWMFHQSNLRAYDGRRTLLGDLLDRTIDKYTAIYSAPVVSPTLDQLGTRMAERLQWRLADVKAVIRPGRSITLSATRDATVRVTGLHDADAEFYAGQFIGTVRLKANQPVTVPLR